MRTHRLAAVSTILFLTILAAPQAAAQPVSHLVNPGFEAGFHDQGAPELTIPDGWTLVYRDGDHPWCRPPCKRPEVKPNTEHVVEGRYSVRAFPPAHSKALWAIYQELEVEPGSTWRFTCRVRTESKPEGGLLAYVGIQPKNADVFDRSMIWGPEVYLRGEWTEASVEAKARAGRIKVAFGASNDWATQNNTTWWDFCRFEPVTAGECPPCPECPECPGDCPPCPGAFDWITLVKLVRAVVEDEIANREPVRWPR